MNNSCYLPKWESELYKIKGQANNLSLMLLGQQGLETRTKVL